jgi:hypothetical protein
LTRAGLEGGKGFGRGSTRLGSGFSTILGGVMGSGGGGVIGSLAGGGGGGIVTSPSVAAEGGAISSGSETGTGSGIGATITNSVMLALGVGEKARSHPHAREIIISTAR